MEYLITFWFRRASEALSINGCWWIIRALLKNAFRNTPSIYDQVLITPATIQAGCQFFSFARREYKYLNFVTFFHDIHFLHESIGIKNMNSHTHTLGAFVETVSNTTRYGETSMRDTVCTQPNEHLRSELLCSLYARSKMYIQIRCL